MYFDIYLFYFIFLFKKCNFKPTVRRGGSNSIVLQYYCKVLQYFGIATSQSIAISLQNLKVLQYLLQNFQVLQKLLQIFKVLQKVLQKFSSIAKSIARNFKYCKNYYKIWKYCKKYCKIQKYCKISRSGRKYQLWYSLLNFDW